MNRSVLETWLFGREKSGASPTTSRPSASILAEDWADVPHKVSSLVRRGKLVQASVADRPEQFLWWQPNDDSLFAEPVTGCVLVKAAAPLGWVGTGWSALNKVTGGHNGTTPLSAAIAGGLLLGGGAYAGGHVASRYLPADKFDQKALRSRLGMIGAAAGVLPGLWAANAAGRLSQQAGKPMTTWQSLTTPFAQIPLEKRSAEGGPYRDRVEVFAQHPDGRIYGGVWEGDKSFAAPGGGIDPGEDIATAGLREFNEETGLTASNPRLVPIHPIVSEWSDKHRATQPQDRQHFRGTRTHFILADLPSLDKRPGKLDSWKATDKRLYHPSEAVATMVGKTPMAPAVFSGRRWVLNHLHAEQVAREAKQEEQTKAAAIHPALPKLQEAKLESDRKNYAKKHEIMRTLVDENPDDFERTGHYVHGGFVGVIHKPTNFKMHLPEQMLAKVAGEFEDPVRAQHLAWRKAAMDGYGSAGGLNTPTIPVDAFNRVVWNDVRPGAAANNPWGTKSQWGDNSQSLHTPPAVAAATTGLLSGIAANHGTKLLSTQSVINGLVGAGTGYAAATLAGKTLGAMAGLRPHAQQQLQQVGVWGGLLSAVIPPLFGAE